MDLLLFEQAMRTFGHIAGYPPGSVFENRRVLAEAGVHRPRQAGISGSGPVGADSIVLSGGYEDDRDLGDTLLYTGAGGRDAETGVQRAHQLLTRTNLALARSGLEGLAVRLVRGAGASAWSPAEGYRYDGLYRVVRYERERGRSGFLVWTFRLELDRNDDLSLQHFLGLAGALQPGRALTTEQRIVRNPQVARAVKRAHRYRCQVCKVSIATRAGPYAEAAHIRPLGRPHSGPDVIGNVLCLCPNHHVMFDHGVFTIGDELELLGLGGKLKTAPSHPLDRGFLRYHRLHIFSEVLS